MMLHVMLEKMVMEDFALAMGQLGGLKDNGKNQCVPKEIVMRVNPLRHAKGRRMVIQSGMAQFAWIKKDTLNALY